MTSQLDAATIVGIPVPSGIGKSTDEIVCRASDHGEMYFLGVDLGTTYTAAAVHREGRAEMVQLGTRAASIPSSVYLREDGESVVGDAAVRRGLADPARLASQTKRRFGDPVPLVLGGTVCPVEVITARLLGHVVDLVADREGSRASMVAVSHPANWGPYKLELLTQVCQMAGLDRFVLIAEPVGAAVHYASQSRVADGSTVLVYDLGGGTFDVAVLTKHGESFAVVGRPEGVDRLGGLDVDAVVLQHVLDSLGPDANGIDGPDPAATIAMARLRSECVDAKEALSSDTDTDVAFAWNGIDTRVRITRAELEARSRLLLDESIAATKRALRSAAIESSDLDHVLLVGGASRMPLVAELVGAALGRPVSVDADPKHSVALGAAHVAATALVEVAAFPSGDQRSPVVGPTTPPARPEPNPSTVSAGVAIDGDSSPGLRNRIADDSSADATGRARPRRKVVRNSLAAVAIAVTVAASGIGALAFGGVLGGDPPPAAVGGVESGWTSPCPNGGAGAVCIESVAFTGNDLAVSFQPRGVQLSAPPLQEGEVAPVFFLTAGTAADPYAALATGPDARRWGPASPMQGQGAAGDRGWSTSTLPGAATAVCVALFDASGRAWPESGNCAALPR